MRWKLRIPLLDSQFKREMELVERAAKGTFNWNDFLFPSEKPEAPLKKPKDLIAVVEERLSSSEADPRFDRAREVLFAWSYYVRTFRSESPISRPLGPDSEVLNEDRPDESEL